MFQKERKLEKGKNNGEKEGERGRDRQKDKYHIYLVKAAIRGEIKLALDKVFIVPVQAERAVALTSMFSQ